MYRILIVDDEPICRELLAVVLRNEGFDPLVATGGREALRLAIQYAPDVILLDVAMPEIDGLTALAAIRKNPKTRTIPVLLLAETARRDQVEQARQLGAHGILLKSAFSLNELLARIRRLCAGKPATMMSLAGVGTTQASNPPRQRLTRGDTSQTGLHSKGSAGLRSSIRSASVAAVGQPGAQQERAALSPKPTLHPGSDPGTPAPIRVFAGNHEAPADLQPIITEEEITHLVNEGLELKALAPVVHGVIAATSNPHCSLEDVARELSYDQAMAVRVLKLANTSLYGRSRPASDLKQAVSLIGLKEIRRIVLALGVIERYADSVSQYVHPEAFWEHSIACGVIGSAIARKVGLETEDQYFLWGLLHDVGRLMLIERVPDKYTEALRTARDLQVPLEHVERKLLHIDHCEILRRALHHWRFPAAFIEPVVRHHTMLAGLGSSGTDQVREAAVIAMADALAHALRIGDSGNEMIYPVDELAEILGLNQEFLNELESTVPEKTKDLKYALLARSGGMDWQEQTSPHRTDPGRPLRVLSSRLDGVVDVYSLFFRSLRTAEDLDTPNLGMIYLPDARRLAEGLHKFNTAEKAAGVGPLPLLVICHKGADKITLEEKSHRGAILQAPVGVATLIDTVNELGRA